MLMSKRSNKGFSFIELLASLAILGLLASLAMPLAQATVRREKERDLRRALREIRTGIDAYKAAANSGEISIDADASGYPPSLTSLVEGVPAARAGGRTLYFLRRLPRDPFFSDPSTPAALTWGLRSSASSPEKPQKGDDVFDVYSLSEETALNGTPYKEW
jgi:general secretion pathway protein G